PGSSPTPGVARPMGPSGAPSGPRHSGGGPLSGHTRHVHGAGAPRPAGGGPPSSRPEQRPGQHGAGGNQAFQPMSRDQDMSPGGTRSTPGAARPGMGPSGGPGAGSRRRGDGPGGDGGRDREGGPRPSSRPLPPVAAAAPAAQRPGGPARPAAPP